MEISRNYRKYLEKNPIKKLLMYYFFLNLRRLFEKTEAKFVLDAGCGEGFVANYLKRYFDVNIIGLDINKNVLNIAKGKNKTCLFNVGDMESLPFKDNRFDLILANEVLEHLNKPELALKELKRCTKKYCLISVPHEPYFTLSNFLCGKNLRYLGKDPEHLWFWRKNEVVSLISNYFKIEEIRKSFPWIILLCVK